MRAYHVLNETGFVVIEDIKRPKSARYVIQDHDAHRAGKHWDLRIHHQKTAISWAVPKHVSPGVGQPLLAIRQPDHSPEYMDFEGVIPEGQLGAGAVKKAGEGIVDILKIETSKSGMKELHLRFHGDLEGDFVLIETGGRKGNDWIWVAKRGPEALPEIHRHKFAIKPRDHLDKIEKTCAGKCVAEVKVDGHHEIVHVTEHGLRLASHRLGKHTGVPIEHSDKVPHLRDTNPKTLGEGGGTIFHAELHIKGQSAATTGGVLNSGTLRARSEQQKLGVAQLKVFDIVQLRGEDVRGLSYEDRRRVAEEAVKELGSPDIHYVRGTRSNFDSFYGRVVTAREFRYRNVPVDGVVVKDLRRPYQENGHPWWKVKPHDEVDLVIVGYTEQKTLAGAPKGTLGALTVVTPEGKTIQVPGGYSNRERDWIWKNRDLVVGDTAKVLFHERPGSPYTGPRFDGFHPGKSERGALMALELPQDEERRHHGQA